MSVCWWEMVETLGPLLPLMWGPYQARCTDGFQLRLGMRSKAARQAGQAGRQGGAGRQLPGSHLLQALQGGLQVVVGDGLIHREVKQLPCRQRGHPCTHSDEQSAAPPRLLDIPASRLMRYMNEVGLSASYKQSSSTHAGSQAPLG
jgi:hypothetical protein